MSVWLIMSDHKEKWRDERQILIYCNSGGIWSVRGGTSEKQPIRMINSFYEVFAFAIQCAGDFTNDRPRRFLNKDYIEVWLNLENSIDDKMVLANVLWKNLEVFRNHIFCLPLSVEWIDLILFLWILAYFFCCYSLLNQCLQKRHLLELAWWSPQQLEHLKECGHGSPFLVSRWGGFVFLFALQYHLNLW